VTARPPPDLSNAPPLTCPIDGTQLRLQSGGALQCANGHSFDRAREGYYNLLVVQHKASLDPGDSKEMVAARRRILDAGHYAPIANAVRDHVARWALELGEGSHAVNVLDAGCGEGYYLEAISNAGIRGGGQSSQPSIQMAGVDISKWAVQAAAKRTNACFWAVATNRHLPFAKGSIDLILSMFGFPLWDAFARVQPLRGQVILVDPGADHLIELRSIIYPEVRQAPAPSFEAARKSGYDLQHEQRLIFKTELTNAAQIADLLAMTPHDHRAPMAGRDALAQLERLSVTGDVAIRVFAKRDETARQP
jgi:23S rRNA (guanine745-N1)-methyltransferase